MPKKFVGDLLTVSLTPGIENLMLKMVMSRFSVQMFCPIVLKNFVGEPLCVVFQKTSGSKNFLNKNGGKCHDFPSKVFCLTLPKNIIEETFSVSMF